MLTECMDYVRPEMLKNKIKFVSFLNQKPNLENMENMGLGSIQVASTEGKRMFHFSGEF